MEVLEDGRCPFQKDPLLVYSALGTLSGDCLAPELCPVLPSLIPAAPPSGDPGWGCPEPEVARQGWPSGGDFGDRDGGAGSGFIHRAGLRVALPSRHCHIYFSEIPDLDHQRRSVYMDVRQLLDDYFSSASPQKDPSKDAWGLPWAWNSRGSSGILQH